MINNTTSKNTKKLLSIRKVITMIRNGATWEDVERETGYHRTHIQRKLKTEHYNTEVGYKKILKKARENAKHKREIAKLIAINPPVEEEHEVILTETGYLMKVGLNGILNESLDIIIPKFCISELNKLARNYSSADEVLRLIWSTNRITCLNLKEEILFEEPFIKPKDRVVGIVAICCHLYCQDIKVRLLTTSFEVAKLAEAQGFPPEAVKVELVRNNNT